MARGAMRHRRLVAAIHAQRGRLVAVVAANHSQAPAASKPNLEQPRRGACIIMSSSPGMRLRANSALRTAQAHGEQCAAWLTNLTGKQRNDTIHLEGVCIEEVLAMPKVRTQINLTEQQKAWFREL